MLYVRSADMNKRSKEENWNTYTHLLGVLFALVAFPLLILSSDSGNSIKLPALFIYGLSFLLLYIASSVYHWLIDEKKKRLWRKIDHISIYFMIAGSYVPYMMEYINYSSAIIFMMIMYTLVAIGSILKIWFTGKFEYASLILYVFLGWMILFMARSFFTNASTVVLAMVVLGGLMYMSGIFFYMRDHKKYYHAVWHVFVLLGSIFHFAGVYLM